MNLAMGAVPWASHEPEAPQSSWDHQMAKDSSGWFRPSWPITLSLTVLVGTCRRRSRPCPPHRRTLCCGYVRLKLLTGPRCLLQFSAKRRECLPKREIYAVPAVQRADRRCQAGKQGREAQPGTAPDTLGLPLWLCLGRGAVRSADIKVGSQLQGQWPCVNLH